MRRAAALLGLLLLLVPQWASEWAIAATQGFRPMVPLGYCRFVGSQMMTAVGLADCPGGIPVQANAILITVDSGNVRWRDDGGAIDGVTGMAIQPTLAPFEYDGDLRAIRFITGNGGILNITFYQVL